MNGSATKKYEKSSIENSKYSDVNSSRITY